MTATACVATSCNPGRAIVWSGRRRGDWWPSLGWRTSPSSTPRTPCSSSIAATRKRSARSSSSSRRCAGTGSDRAGTQRRTRVTRGPVRPVKLQPRLDPKPWGGRLLEATGGQPIFPLLVKLIDGQADLSIQVHPDDRAAAAAGLGTGKTEAYHILAAEPGSVIYLGIQPEVRLE